MNVTDVAAPLAGGALIGLSATMLLLTHGKIAGISGLYGSLFESQAPQRSLAISFLGGLLVTGLVIALVAPGAIGAPTVSMGWLVAAGLFVGFGTRLGNGCTSGHGVCGISRVSPRSLVATLTFIATGALTVLATRSLGGGS